MIKEVIMWTVVCDNCGKRADHDVETSCWESPESARLMAEYDEWIEVDGKEPIYEVKQHLNGKLTEWKEVTFVFWSYCHPSERRKSEKIESKDYCPVCVSYDDEDNLILKND